MKLRTIVILLIVVVAAVSTGVYSFSALFPSTTQEQFHTVKVTRRDLGANRSGYRHSQGCGRSRGKGGVESPRKGR